MSDNQNNNQGAPSSDNTSALFVSARKKQLAQQEEQRVAAEKEAARLAAEEEVRRLEAEVEERKRKAQEDAVRIQQEEEERRKQAEIEKARIAADVRSAATAAPSAPVVATGSTFAAPKQGVNIQEKINAFVDELKNDRKKLIMTAAIAAGVVVLIIVFSIIGASGSAGRFTHSLDSSVYIELSEDGTASGVSPSYLEFDGTWYTDGSYVVIESDTYNSMLSIVDENTIVDMEYEGEFVFGS